MEIEAKYALLDSRAMDHLIKDPFWQNYLIDKPKIDAYEARYLDAETGEIAELKASVRLRREGEMAVATVKWPVAQAPASNKAVSIRGEYNLILQQRDFSRWREEILAQESFYQEVPLELVKIIQDKVLSPRYRATFDRCHAKLRFAASVFEFSMDQGFLLVGQLSERISEIEIEFLEGQESDLYDFGQKLEASFAVYALEESKFSRLLSLEKKALGT